MENDINFEEALNAIGLKPIFVGFNEDKEMPNSLKCFKCKAANLVLMSDEYGTYYKCLHCGWDSADLYKTKGKHSK